MGNEKTKKKDLKIKNDNSDGATRPLCLDANKLTMK